MYASILDQFSFYSGRINGVIIPVWRQDLIHGTHSQLDVITDNIILDCQVKYILQGGNVKRCSSFDKSGDFLFNTIRKRAVFDGAFSDLGVDFFFVHLYMTFSQNIIFAQL